MLLPDREEWEVNLLIPKETSWFLLCSPGITVSDWPNLLHFALSINQQCE